MYRRTGLSSLFNNKFPPKDHRVTESVDKGTQLSQSLTHSVLFRSL